jgi:hypothetical protein
VTVSQSPTAATFAVTTMKSHSDLDTLFRHHMAGEEIT